MSGEVDLEREMDRRRVSGGGGGGGNGATAATGAISVREFD